MNHQDHVFLLRCGFPEPGGIWAEFGSGKGAFTLALAELLGPCGEIFSVDKDKQSLRSQQNLIKDRFPDSNVHYLEADFTKPLNLPALDGVLMANSLHFVRRKEPVLKLIHKTLKSNGRLILVEYNVDRGNIWVPYPISLQTWIGQAERDGFARTELLATRPSRFLGEIFSAISWKG